MTDFTALQRLMKSDPCAYHEDLLRYRAHFAELVAALTAQTRLGVALSARSVDDVVQHAVFLGNVAEKYRDELAALAGQVAALLRDCALPPRARVALTKVLIGLRSKGFLSVAEAVPALLGLLAGRDKSVRGLVCRFVVEDVRRAAGQRGGADARRAVVAQLERLVAGSPSAKVARAVVGVLGELFHRGVLADARVANVVAGAVFHPDTKVRVRAVEFFLRDDERAAEADDETRRELAAALEEHRVAKKKLGIKKRTGRLRAQVRAAEERIAELRRTEVVERRADWAAIDALYDPHGFCDRLFRAVKASRDRFAVRLRCIDLLTRVVARHRVVCAPFYSFVVRYLHARHEAVTDLLAHTAQAVHEEVPPDLVEPVVRAILNNFVTDRSRPEAQALGLNTVRVICERCPDALGEAGLRDLALYKKSHSRAVVAAARGIIGLYRKVDPAKLHKKDRGRPEGKKKGAVDAMDASDEEEGETPDSEGEGSDGGWETDDSMSVDNISDEEDVEDEEEAMDEEQNVFVEDEAEEVTGDASSEESSDEEERVEMECEEEDRIVSQETLEAARRRRLELAGVSSSEDEEEPDTTRVTADDIAPSVRRKLEREERAAKRRAEREEKQGERFRRARGRTSTVDARNKPFMMRRFKKRLGEETRGLRARKGLRVQQGKIRKRFGKSGLKQKPRRD